MMTDNYYDYSKAQMPPMMTRQVAPLSDKEKAELKMRIAMAISEKN